MKLEVARIIVFAKDMTVMTAFYEDVLGLTRVETPDDAATFVSFDAGGVQLSLHQIPRRYARHIEIADPPAPRADTPIKIAFRVADVAAAKAAVESLGARMGPVQRSGNLHLCDGTDPEGNIFQLSNRP